MINFTVRINNDELEKKIHDHFAKIEQEGIKASKSHWISGLIWDYFQRKEGGDGHN